MKSREGYPYLVVRYIPAAYSRCPIEFVEHENVKPNEEVLTLVEPHPFDAEGRITPKCREALMEAVKHEARRRRFRMCIVFGERDALYIEPDGKVSQSSDPPSGGLDLGPIT